MFSAAALSTALAVPVGSALAGPVVDALKQTDPSLPAVDPPRVGDAIEAEAKAAGGAPKEYAPPPDVAKAISEGVKRADVPDPLKTVLPETSTGFGIQDKLVGMGERAKNALELGPGEGAAKARDSIVNKALTPQSPKKNYGN